MRLRRETGDFQIKINSENAVNTIRKGLSAEDFVGELVNVNGTYEVVNSANDTETGAEFKTNSFTLTYTKATGAITAEEGGSGSGSGSGGGDEYMPRVIVMDDMPYQYETGLSADDFIGAYIGIVSEGVTAPIIGVSPDPSSDVIGIIAPGFSETTSDPPLSILVPIQFFYNSSTGVITSRL